MTRRGTACHDRPMSADLRRLHPAPPGRRRRGGLRRHAAEPAADARRRPPVGALCMIASLDGAVVVDGRSGPLGNANDLGVLLTLRDAGRRDRRRRRHGARRGLRPAAQGRAAHRRGDQLGHRSTWPARCSPVGCRIPDRARVGRRRRRRRRRAARRHATGRPGARPQPAATRSCPVSGSCRPRAGRRSMRALLAADLVDELNLTISPRLVGRRQPAGHAWRAARRRPLRARPPARRRRAVRVQPLGARSAAVTGRQRDRQTASRC